MVEPFTAASAWYREADAATATVAAGRDWGELLTEKVTTLLRFHFSQVARSERALSPAEIRLLIRRKMLSYLLGGNIERLAADPDGAPWRLTVTYSLRRLQGGSLHVMQKERLDATARSATPLEARDLDALVSAAAAQIAGRVAPAISADILAARD